MNVLGITFLAVFLEGTINYIVGTSNEGARPWVRYIALVAGVGLAIAYQIDLLAQLGLVSPIPVIGFVISGIVIGRGSNYVNDVISVFKNK